MTKLLKFILFLACFFTGGLFAAHGTVTGTVTDSGTSNPISGATVSFYRPGGIFEGSTTTDLNGVYTWASNDPHNYIMTVNATGYNQVVLSVKIESNQTITVDVPMQLGNNSIAVTVTGVSAGLPVNLNLYLDNILVAQTTVTSTPPATYTFLGLSPGNYVVTALSSGYGFQSVGAQVTSGQTNVSLTLSALNGDLQGTVVDEFSNPLGDVIVQVFQNNVVVAQTTTNPSGFYSILGLSPGSYVIVASKLGYGSSSQGANIVDGQTSTADFILPLDHGYLNGTVKDGSNNPIASASIQVLQNNVVVFTTVTGADGSYGVTGINPGSYTVVASKANYQTSSQGTIINSNQVSTVNFVLSLNPGTLTGNVKDANTSSNLAGVLVEVNLNNVVLFSTLTDNSGNYSFASLAPGSYVIHAHITGYQSGVSGVIIPIGSPPAPQTLNFLLNLNPGTLNGVVKDTNSNPLSGVLVEVNQNNVVLFSTLTDSNGFYQFSSLAPGSYVIHAHDAGYQSGIAGALITSGATTTLNFVLAQNPGALVGKVVDSNGNPLSGVTVEVNFANVVLFTTLTDPSGNYQFNSLTPGVYSIHAHLNNYQSGIQPGVGVFADQTTTVNFTLSLYPAAVQGNVQNSVLVNIPGATVELNINNVVVDSCLTDALGNYLLQNQAPGSYVMHAHAQGYATGLANVLLSPGGTVTQNFNLIVGTSSISGSCFNVFDLSPISGAFVELYIDNGGVLTYIDTFVSNGNGNYEFLNLASGNYKIIARKYGFLPYLSQDISVNSSVSYPVPMSPIIPGPLSGKGEVVVNRFLMRADRIHVIEWTQSPSPYVKGYNIYRNGQFVKFISKNDPLIYEDHNRSYNQTDSYNIVSVSLSGYEGGSFVVTLR